jgi:ubiquinone/menaquinone biosynthesis C-methylase UbiE
VLQAIADHLPSPADVLDLGTADGRMLNAVHQRYPTARCVGVEYTEELAAFAAECFPDVEILQGDCQALDFADESFDVAIATAVIEHVPDPARMVREAKRVLRAGGILVLTSPDPFWERVATMTGHLRDDQHHLVMTLKQLTELMQDGGFAVVTARKFMLSPIGMPMEITVERAVRFFKLGCLMANQLVVARRPSAAVENMGYS